MFLSAAPFVSLTDSIAIGTIVARNYGLRGKDVYLMWSRYAGSDECRRQKLGVTGLGSLGFFMCSYSPNNIPAPDLWHDASQATIKPASGEMRPMTVCLPFSDAQGS